MISAGGARRGMTCRSSYLEVRQVGVDAVQDGHRGRLDHGVVGDVLEAGKRGHQRRAALPAPAMGAAPRSTCASPVKRASARASRCPMGATDRMTSSTAEMLGTCDENGAATDASAADKERPICAGDGPTACLTASSAGRRAPRTEQCPRIHPLRVGRRSRWRHRHTCPSCSPLPAAPAFLARHSHLPPVDVDVSAPQPRYTEHNVCYAGAAPR